MTGIPLVVVGEVVGNKQQSRTRACVLPVPLSRNPVTLSAPPRPSPALACRRNDRDESSQATKTAETAVSNFFDFILEKPATRPRDRCGKEQLVYPFVTGFPGSSRVSALAPYSSGDRVGSTLSTPHAGGDLGLFRW